MLVKYIILIFTLNNSLPSPLRAPWTSRGHEAAASLASIIVRHCILIPMLYVTYMGRCYPTSKVEGPVRRSKDQHTWNSLHMCNRISTIHCSLSVIKRETNSIQTELQHFFANTTSNDACPQQCGTCTVTKRGSSDIRVRYCPRHRWPTVR